MPSKSIHYSGQGLIFDCRDNKEKGEKLGAFFNNEAAPPKTLSRIPKVLEGLKSETSATKWAAVGYCWGGKIVSLSSQEGTPFSAVAECHPAR